MSAFDDAIEDLEAVNFETLGIDALWNGVAVRIRLHTEADRDVGFGHASAIVASTIVVVRVSEVQVAAEGDVVQFGGDNYQVIAEPKLRDRRRRRWTCELERV